MYQVGDVVLLSAEYRSDLLAIVELAEHPVNRYKASDGKKLFRIRDEQIVRKVGTLLTSDPMITSDRVAAAAADPTKVANDQKYCRGVMRLYPEGSRDHRFWAFLAERKPGDKLTVAVGFEELETMEYLEPASGAKYAFVARRSNGGYYKFQLKQLVLPEPAKTEPRPTAGALMKRAVKVKKAEETFTGPPEPTKICKPSGMFLGGVNTAT